METRIKKNSVSKKAVIHFAFSTINFEGIIGLIWKTYQSGFVDITAKTVNVDDLDCKKCNELSLNISEDNVFFDIETKKQSCDSSLFILLSSLQKMKPEELIITVSDNITMDNYYWKIIIMFYENIATVCYDRSFSKKEINQTLGMCFK